MTFSTLSSQTLSNLLRANLAQNGTIHIGAGSASNMTVPPSLVFRRYKASNIDLPDVINVADTIMTGDFANEMITTAHMMAQSILTDQGNPDAYSLAYSAVIACYFHGWVDASLPLNIVAMDLAVNYVINGELHLPAVYDSALHLTAAHFLLAGKSSWWQTGHHIVDLSSGYAMRALTSGENGSRFKACNIKHLHAILHYADTINLFHTCGVNTVDSERFEPIIPHSIGGDIKLRLYGYGAGCKKWINARSIIKVLYGTCIINCLPAGMLIECQRVCSRAAFIEYHRFKYGDGAPYLTGGWPAPVWKFENLLGYLGYFATKCAPHLSAAKSPAFTKTYDNVDTTFISVCDNYSRAMRNSVESILKEIEVNVTASELHIQSKNAILEMLKMGSNIPKDMHLLEGDEEKELAILGSENGDFHETTTRTVHQAPLPVHVHKESQQPTKVVRLEPVHEDPNESENAGNEPAAPVLPQSPGPSNMSDISTDNILSTGGKSSSEDRREKLKRKAEEAAKAAAEAKKSKGGRAGSHI